MKLPEKRKSVCPIFDHLLMQLIYIKNLLQGIHFFIIHKEYPVICPFTQTCQNFSQVTWVRPPTLVLDMVSPTLFLLGAGRSKHFSPAWPDFAQMSSFLVLGKAFLLRHSYFSHVLFVLTGTWRRERDRRIVGLKAKIYLSAHL